MKSGRTPSDAFSNYIDPLQRALNLITVGRLVHFRNRRGIAVDSVETALLNNGNLAPMNAGRLGTISISAGFQFRIVRASDIGDQFRCETVEYWYSFQDASEQELLTCYWTPEAQSPLRSHPHVYIGNTVTKGSSFLPERFHKLHIPTAPLSAAAIIRFAVEELDVKVRSGTTRDAVLEVLSETSSTG